MLLTQRKAISEIRARTGLSERSATAAVAKMLKQKDGCRFKVLARDVEAVIYDTNHPATSSRKADGTKGFSPRLVSRMRREGAEI
jgi:hypothetical protein